MKKDNLLIYIKELRKLEGLTQQELAEKLGVSQNAIHNWETGKREPSIEMIRQIANALNTTPDVLLWGEDTANKINEVANVKAEATKESKETLQEAIEIIKDFILSCDEANIFTGIPEEELLYCFWLLNHKGQKEAVKRVEELTEIPKYQKEKEEN